MTRKLEKNDHASTYLTSEILGAEKKQLCKQVIQLYITIYNTQSDILITNEANGLLSADFVSNTR